MYAFTYHKAKDVKDAAAMLAKNADAKLLAGGQSLVAAMKLRLAATRLCPSSSTWAAFRRCAASRSTARTSSSAR